MDPISDFFKYAKRVRVREHKRTDKDGDVTVVDAHDRSIEDLSVEDDDDVLLGDTVQTAVQKSGEFDIDMDGIPDRDEDFLDANGKYKVEKIDVPKLKQLTREEELALWHEWKKNGQKPKDLEPLLHSFKPLIRHKAGVYMGRVKMIPDAAIEGEYNLRFVEALKTYNPEKGGLTTYIYRYLDKAKRFIGENQNVGRIPENRIYKIKQFTNMRERMMEETGNQPTLPEMAKRLSWPLAEVDRMDAELRSDLLAQGFEADPSEWTPSKAEEVLKLFKYELAGTERDVYEHLTGYGKPKMKSTGEIARKLGIPDYQVSRYKDSIQRKLSKYVKDE